MPPEAAGKRLDRFLATQEGVGSRAAAERLVSEGAVLVDGARRAKSHRLEGGEDVELELPDRREPALVPEPVEGLHIAYEDEHLLVVDKPAGVVVHPSSGHPHGTLVHGLLAHAVTGGGEPGGRGSSTGSIGTPRACSWSRARRRPTAGCSGFCAGESWSGSILVLVRGRPRSRAGRIEAPIGRDRRDPTRHSLDTATPRDAVTEFEVLDLLPRYALLRARLQTGRTHQIRVHLGAIDLPVVGDPTYGVPGDLGLERQFLHAARLAFPHPLADERVDVTSPLPPDLARALDMARTGDAPGADQG